MNQEVRYHMPRPGTSAKRREVCPAAYMPADTLEWHGLHNPGSADTPQAEVLTIRCAAPDSGHGFPPRSSGESRRCRPEAYHGHGNSLPEGLWRDEA